MRGRITKSLVDKTIATDEVVVVFDSEVAGFVLKALPSGRKTFQLRYRMGGRNTPKKTFTIGPYGVLTPEQARRQAQVLVGDIRRGIDPAADKSRRAAEERGAVTLALVAADFTDLHLKAKRKLRTFEEYDRLLRNVIVPQFGGHGMKQILAGEIERWHHGMRATPYQANRALAVLSKLLSWAASRGYVDGDNPCRSVERFKEVARRRYLAPVEIAKLGEAIRTCESDGSITRHMAAFFRVLLLTGLRKDELRLLTWDRIDLERRVLVLGDLDSKSGRRDVPLSGPVLQIFSELPRFGGNPFVFIGKRTDRSFVNAAKPWARVLAVAGIEAARIHDLRHTAASIAVSTGASLLLIGGVLGHRSPQTTQRYAHLSDDPVRAVSEAIAERMTSVLAGETGEVVRLRER